MIVRWEDLDLKISYLVNVPRRRSPTDCVDVRYIKAGKLAAPAGIWVDSLSLNISGLVNMELDGSVFVVPAVPTTQLDMFRLMEPSHAT